MAECALYLVLLTETILKQFLHKSYYVNISQATRECEMWDIGASENMLLFNWGLFLKIGTNNFPLLSVLLSMYILV